MKEKKPKRYKVIAGLYNAGSNDKDVRVGDATGPFEDGTFNIVLDTLPVMHARWNGHLQLVPLKVGEK